MAKLSQKQVEQIVIDFNTLCGDRGNWEDLWQRCADFCLPSNNNITTIASKGERRGINRYVDVGIRSNEILAGRLFSYLTPPNQIWFKLNSSDEGLAKDASVMDYFGKVNQQLRDTITSSNFILQIHELFMALGTFGTVCMFTDPASTKGIDFHNFHIKNIYIRANSKGKVDTVFRKISYTIRQAIQEFGEKNIHPEMLKQYKEGKSNGEKFDFFHACFPRKDRQYGKIDAENKPFASVYIDVKHKHCVSEGGYDTFPYHVARFMKDTDEDYGRSPAMQCMCSLDTGNVMKKDILKAGEQIVNPQWLLPDNGAVSKITSKGGGIIYWNSSNAANKPERLQSNGELGIGLEMISEEYDSVKMAFYNDLFNMLSDKKNMTATEVLERVNEKLVLFNPVVGRIQDELLKPLIGTAYDVLSRRDELPPVPAILQENNDYEISFTGKISLAIEQLEVMALIETMNFFMPLSEVKPDMLDNFNFDDIVRGVSKRNNVPIEWMNAADKVEKIRAARAEQQAQQAQLDQGTQMADAASKLQKTTEAGSPLEEIMGSVQQR